MVRNWLWKRDWRRSTRNHEYLASEEEVQGARKAIVRAQDREVPRLYFDLKLGQRQIARSANVSQSRVHGGGVELAVASADVRG